MLICLMISLLFCFYMLFRNEWVCKIQKRWNSLCQNYHFIRIHNGLYEDVSAEDFRKSVKYNYHKIIYSYTKMWLHFWNWKVSSMVEDKGKYLEIITYVNKELNKGFGENLNETR